MTVANPSFETAGVGAGQADSWTVATTSTYEEIAEYDSTTPESWEDFEEEWGNTPHLTAFETTDLTFAEYEVLAVDDVEYEAFEEGWSNVPYYTELSLLESAVYDGSAFEAFDPWDPSYLTAFVGIGTDLTAAVYDGANAYENFEAADGWDAGYLTAFVGIGTDLTAAEYSYMVGASILTLAYEGFGENPALALTKKEFTVDIAFEYVTTVEAHQIINGNLVTFEAGTGSLPSPLNETTKYVATWADNYNITVDDGGGTVNITDVGTGYNHLLVPDPRYFWVDFMETF